MYRTEIMIFSPVGQTPLTKRMGSYCDLLLKEYFMLDNPAQAKQKIRDLIASIVHNVGSAHYYIPDYPNQNTQCGWV